MSIYLVLNKKQFVFKTRSIFGSDEVHEFEYLDDIVNHKIGITAGPIQLFLVVVFKSRSYGKCMVFFPTLPRQKHL